MSYQEFVSWKAYYNLRPFGEVRDDLRSGIIASTIANCFTAKGKTFVPGDFMINLEDDNKKKVVRKNIKFSDMSQQDQDIYRRAMEAAFKSGWTGKKANG